MVRSEMVMEILLDGKRFYEYNTCLWYQTLKNGVNF